MCAYFAGKGFGSIVPDLPHQIAVGFVVFMLSLLLGKRAALSNPQAPVSLVISYCFGMFFISAAFFVLGFIGDEPVRYCVAEDLNTMNGLTVKYQKEDQKIDDVLKTISAFEKNLRGAAEDERRYGTLTGSPGENGVVYRSYIESADFIESQRHNLERTRNENQENIQSIQKTISDFQIIIWDKTLTPKELQQQAYAREHQLQELFVNIKQNSKTVHEISEAIIDYEKTINDKRADKTDVGLKNSQKEVLGSFKRKLARFADNLDKSPFIDRDENIGTIKLEIHDVYIANLMQMPRYFYLWIVGIMLDIAAPLILYFIIGYFIKKRNKLQEVLHGHEKNIELDRPVVQKQ